eukprot:m.138094 g.138094  ORF g.138094 m.138094 type:complete len:100 (-) comp11478_c0_seq1:1733-2032(-)
MKRTNFDIVISIQDMTKMTTSCNHPCESGLQVTGVEMTGVTVGTDDAEVPVETLSDTPDRRNNILLPHLKGDGTALPLTRDTTLMPLTALTVRVSRLNH